MVDKIEYFK